MYFANYNNGWVKVEANGVLPTQEQNQKKLRDTKWRHAGPERANQRTRVTEGGQVKEGEDEEPINSDCGEQIGEVAGL